MKSYILLIAVIVAVTEVKATITEKFIETHEQCMSDAGVSVEDVKALFTLKVQESIKCYLKCFIEKEGFWHNGSLDVQKAQSVVSQFKFLQKYAGQINGALEKCKDAEGASDCDKAFAVAKCLVINGVKIFLGTILNLVY